MLRKVSLGIKLSVYRRLFLCTNLNTWIKLCSSNTLLCSVQSWLESGQMFLFTLHPSPSHSSSPLLSEWEASAGQHLKSDSQAVKVWNCRSYRSSGLSPGPEVRSEEKTHVSELKSEDFLFKTQHVRVLTWKKENGAHRLVPTGWHSGNS